MVENDKTLTTGEFSQLTGIPVPTVTQMLRRNKIRGEKRSGKWAIYESELQNTAVLSGKDRRDSSDGPGTLFNTQTVAREAYDVETFAQLTYLTVKGVRQWLKTGRITGSTDADGKILVDAANLDRPELKHLVRK